MRTFMGLVLLSVLALAGVERVSSGLTGAGFSFASLTGSQTAPASGTSATIATPAAPRSIITTIAIADPDEVQAGEAPRAVPIQPIVAAPAKRTSLKGSVAETKATKAKPATSNPPQPTGSVKTAATPPAIKPDATLRPGFKLSCTAEQRLDTVKQRCIPLKGSALASANAR